MTYDGTYGAFFIHKKNLAYKFFLYRIGSGEELFRGVFYFFDNNLYNMSALKNYIQGAIQELNHVTWPTKPQIIRISMIVIGFIIISAIVLGGVDYVLSLFFQLLLNIN